MSLDWYKDVKDFHIAFGLTVNEKPTIPLNGTVVLRKKIIAEEIEELWEAFESEDLAKIADALADLIYVINGTAVSYGIDLRPIHDLVHAANMKKVGGNIRGDGKVLKPYGWQHPNIEKEVERQIDA